MFRSCIFISNKAVANGAVLSHIDRDNHLIASRVARTTYGVVCSLLVQANDEEHVRRKRQWERDPDGKCYVQGCFKPTLSKVCLLHLVARRILIRSHYKGAFVREEMEFLYPFSLTESTPEDFGVQNVRILCYRGQLPDPKWVDQDQCRFLTLCLTLSFRRGAFSIFFHVLYYPRRPERGCEGCG